VGTLENKHIAFVGLGVMGEVLVERVLAVGLMPREQIIACEPRADRQEIIRTRLGVVATADNRNAADADILVFCVPPVSLIPVLTELATNLRPGHIVISVAAAVPVAAIEASVGSRIVVVRALTNSPALIGQGVTAVSWGRHSTPPARGLIKELLACWGDAVEVPDELMNLCVGLTAAAPTYIFPIIEAMANAAVQGGLPPDLALRMAAGVVRGCGELVLQTGKSPAELQALTPLQPLREAEARALFAEAVQVARSKMDALQGKLKL